MVNFEVHTAFFLIVGTPTNRTMRTEIFEGRFRQGVVKLTFPKRSLAGNMRVNTASGILPQRSLLIGRNGCAREIRKTPGEKRGSDIFIGSPSEP